MRVRTRRGTRDQTAPERLAARRLHPVSGVRGDIEVTEEVCDEHELPHLLVTDGDDDDDPWELGCPICNYADYRERQAASEVEDLDGVGAKTAEKLAAAGIGSLDDLRGADVEAVADEVQGVSEDRLREWQAAANASAAAD